MIADKSPTCSPDRYLRALVEGRFRSLVDRARQVRSLPPDLALQPPIELRVVDQRSNKAVPLPASGR